MANFIIRVMSLATFPFLVRFYLREDIAIYKSFQSLVLILMAIVPVGTNILYISRAKEERDNRWPLLLTVSFAVSLLAALLLLAVPQLAAFFVEEAVLLQLRLLMAAIALIEGWKIIMITRLSAVMDFKSISISLIIRQLFLYAAVIAFAYIRAELMVLMTAVVVAEVIETVLLYGYFRKSNFRLWPKKGEEGNADNKSIFKLIKLDKIAKKYMLFSGSEQFFITFAVQLPTILAVIVFGRTLAPEFQLPFIAVTVPVSMVMRSIAKVSFPHFSNLRDDEKISSSLFSVIFSVTFILFPVMAGIHFFAQELSLIILDKSWTYAIFALQVFPLMMIAYMLNMPSSYISNVKDKPRINLIYSVGLLAARITGIYVGNLLAGFKGAVVLFVAGDTVVRLIRLAVDIKLVSVSFSKFFDCFRYNFYSLLILSAGMWLLYLFLGLVSPGIAPHHGKIISFIPVLVLSLALNIKWEKDRLKLFLAKVRGK